MRGWLNVGRVARVTQSRQRGKERGICIQWALGSVGMWGSDQVEAHKDLLVLLTERKNDER